MMATRRMQLIVSVFLVILAGADALSGHTVTFWNETTKDSLECVEWNILCDVTKQQLACCRHELVPVSRYDEITTCAEGWHEDNNESCSIAACSSCSSHTFCLSNGTCANFCEVNRTSTCVCSPGFGRNHPYCYLDDVLVNRKITPILILEKINRADNKTLSKLKIRNENTWTNRNGFNRIAIIIPDTYLPEIIQSLHTIYNAHNIITYVSFRKHDLIGRNDSLTDHAVCSGNSTAHATLCTMSAFDRYVDHGDTLDINIKVYFLYSSPEPHSSNRTDRMQTSMNIGFDFQPPVHCTERKCPFQPLVASPEISKGRIHIKWNGWGDQLSGIKHYILHVYKMAPDQAGRLHQPVDTCFTVTTNETNTDYLPPQPGVYAFLLIVEDNASNKNYARRFVLYDNVSRIDVQNSRKLHFSTASNESSYHWQSSNTSISVSWKDHFVNSVHDKGHFLSQIVAGPVVVDNSTVIPKYDDHEGDIKLTATPNVRGIVRFDYVGPLVASPRDNKPDTETWMRLGQLAPEALHKVFTTVRGDGSSVKVWITAYDIMGHTAVDSTYVYFDSSPPTAYGDKAILQKNINAGHFGSRVSMEATDRDSGIYQIQWTIQDTVTGHTLTSGFTAGNRTDDKSECDRNIKECRCGADGACYLFKHYLYIDHCPIQLSKTDLQMADLALHVSVVNYALLTHNFTMKIGKATTLTGIKQYSHPIDIHTPILSTDSVSIAWSFENNCYTRTGIRVSFGRKGLGSSTIHDFKWNVTKFDMIGLVPDTEYVTIFVVHYGNESSRSFEYSFTTESVKPDVKYVVVIVILSLAAVITLTGLLVTYKKLRTLRYDQAPLLPRQLSSQSNGLRRDLKGSDRYKKTPEKMSSQLKIDEKSSTAQYVSGSYEDAAIGADYADDVYEDLDDNVNTPPSIDVTDVKFEKLISEGSFANVLVGTCNISTKGQTRCALKTHTSDLNEGEIQEYEEVAIALLKFHNKHVIHASNILQYYGFVNEGQDSPTLVMEYCANGTLGNWLEKVGNRARVDNLEEMVHGIACGMEYLVARKIFHGNLTSFNVLLNSDLQPKIKGIGGERTSIAKNVRWQAPERFRSDKKPTEATDAWSFGVVTWEVFSEGIKPYEDIAETELEAAIKDGLQLSQPGLCSNAFNGVIVPCLQLDPASRPTFTDILDAIKNTKGSNTHAEIEEQGIYENTDTQKL